MSRSSFPGIVGASLLLVACANPRPTIPDSASVVAPADWREKSGTTEPMGAEWWRTFGDPALNELVERALANNANIAIAVARVSEARATARAVRAQQGPLAIIGASGGKSQIDFLGASLGVLEIQPQVTVSYDLDLFGRLSQASASARAALLSSAASRDNVALAIASTTTSSYITLLSLDARLATTRATLATRADALKYARRRAETGYTSRLELRQAESEYKAAEQLVPVAELAIAQQENALSILLGEAPHPIERARKLDLLTAPKVPGGLPIALLRRRPDLVAAEATLVASDRSLDSARAALLPDISLTGSGGASYSNVNIANPVMLYSLGASVLSPLLDWGRLRAQSDAAAARRDQAAFAYREAALTAFREVEDALVAVNRLEEEQASVGDQIVSLQEALRISTNRYRGGYSPYLDQIDAERGLLAAQLVSIQLESDYLNSFVTLYRALGGGWSEARWVE